jgi:hypothetical protein
MNYESGVFYSLKADIDCTRVARWGHNVSPHREILFHLSYFTFHISGAWLISWAYALRNGHAPHRNTPVRIYLAVRDSLVIPFIGV